MTVLDIISIYKSLKNEIDNLEESNRKFEKTLSDLKESYRLNRDSHIDINDENIKYMVDVCNINDTDGFTVNTLVNRATSKLYSRRLTLCDKRKVYANFLNQDFSRGE